MSNCTAPWAEAFVDYHFREVRPCHDRIVMGAGGTEDEETISPTAAPVKRLKRAVRRRPGPQVTRDAIICAGRKLFTQRGFSASLREIAVEAGIDHALVYRHFESKIDLFNQIFDHSLDEIGDGAGPDGRLILSPGHIDDLVRVAVRSAADPAAATMICDIFERRLIPPLAASLGGEGGAERARMLLAMAAGVEVVRESHALSDAEQQAMETLLARIVSEILTLPVSSEG